MKRCPIRLCSPSPAEAVSPLPPDGSCGQLISNTASTQHRSEVSASGGRGRARQAQGQAQLHSIFHTSLGCTVRPCLNKTKKEMGREVKWRRGVEKEYRRRRKRWEGRKSWEGEEEEQEEGRQGERVGGGKEVASIGTWLKAWRCLSPLTDFQTTWIPAPSPPGNPCRRKVLRVVKRATEA